MSVSLPIFCSPRETTFTCQIGRAHARANENVLLALPLVVLLGNSTFGSLQKTHCEEPGPAETEELQGQTEAKAGELEQAAKIPET